MMRLRKQPTDRTVTTLEQMVVVMVNNRRAVGELRRALRWALSELTGATADGPVARNARRLLADTTPRKLRDGKETQMSGKREVIVIYVVRGHTGEYSDSTDWLIVAVRSEETAQDIVTELDAVARVNGIAAGCTGIPRTSTERKAAMDQVNAHMPGAVQSVDYTGVRFSYEPVNLVRKPEADRT